MATMLIVEDHDAVRRRLYEWLELEFPQCRLVEASSGEEAIVLAITESPRLVLMDITLPEMNGIEATRRIKASLPSAEIVILSFHEDDVYRAQAVRAGASAYVPKRVMLTELAPTLTALLANGHG